MSLRKTKHKHPIYSKLQAQQEYVRTSSQIPHLRDYYLPKKDFINKLCRNQVQINNFCVFKRTYDTFICKGGKTITLKIDVIEKEKQNYRLGSILLKSEAVSELQTSTAR